jgi:hypothetical protein
MSHAPISPHVDPREALRSTRTRLRQAATDLGVPVCCHPAHGVGAAGAAPRPPRRREARPGRHLTHLQSRHRRDAAATIKVTTAC